MKYDFFSLQSDVYARYRPTYPDNLFEFIEQQVQEKKLAWDVATGNGQAANKPASFFDHVHATDLSESQLKNVVPQFNITYKQELAEACSLDDECPDLITIATAIHWFNKEKFFAEAARVLKTGGLLFAWSYGGSTVNEAVDKVMDHFTFVYLFDYWHAGAKENWNDKYKSLQMPFPLIEIPDFIARAEYTLEEVLKYMFSLSGVQEYIKQKGENPLDHIYKPLLEAWGNPEERKEINWHLHGKCCRKS